MSGQFPRALCSGCGLLRQVTTAGVIRRHRKGQMDCSGAGQWPAGPVASPDAVVRSAGSALAIPAPVELAAGRSCDGGGCDAPSVGWRLFRGWREWLPVCGLHMEGPAGRTRVYDLTAEL